MYAGFTLKLKPGGLAEYKRRHDEIWPDLVSELARGGIEQVTIFVDGDTLFIYSQISDADAWSRVWHSDIHIRWAKELEPYLELADDDTPDSTDLQQIFNIRPAEASA